VARRPAHPAFAALADLPEALAALPDGHDGVLHHGARWVAERFAEEQARRAQMGFDDLLTRLDAALQGPNGPRLAERIRTQFPVALIDEFQDTDAVQYRIFDAVYRVAASDPACALILIGDPKQAIYAFRGADIYTYLAARAATAGRLYTLRRNYRSTLAMVEATNRCFEVAEARAEGQGAFLFRRAGPMAPTPSPSCPPGRPVARTACGWPVPTRRP
jgi:exodeoxyribonuclease V beta subunit